MKFVEKYQEISRDYNLRSYQKLQYLHNILSNDAHRFYLDRFAHYATTFQQTVEINNQEYNSPVMQTTLKNQLVNWLVQE